MTQRNSRKSGNARAAIDKARQELEATKGQMILFSQDEARRLTEEVKADAATLWTKLLRLYEGGAHIALGYSSWSAYYEAEFGNSGMRGHQLLQAARVLQALEPVNHGLPEPKAERVARELTPFLDEPEVMAETWQEAQRTAAEEDRPVTARDVKETVQRRRMDPGITAPESVMPIAPTASEEIRRTIARSMPPVPAEPSASLVRWDKGLQAASIAAASIRTLGDYPEDGGPLLALTASEVARALADAAHKLAEAIPENQPALRRVQ